jgi:hypothetical protein
MKNRTCTEFIFNLKEYQTHVRDTYEQDLRDVRVDNDPCITEVKAGPLRNTVELDAYLWSLPVAQAVRFTHSPAEYQALNLVEFAVWQLYYIMNFFLEQGSLSMLCWFDMLRAAADVMNR